ncbi:MAG TPA: cytochrome C oxidase subunit IV family protein [Candidatus Eisenbacteria bacterium]|nr:cytochrome C oxidase subunit IV family protein [Candidatus Eisenbacteria bacterium]
MIPTRVYVAVFFALLVLTAVTTAVSFVDLGGPFNVITAVTIAVVKMLLVALFFMHLRYSSRLTVLFAGAALFWLGIMIVLTVSDYLSRGWVGPFEAMLR